jgi:hypothetical protein
VGDDEELRVLAELLVDPILDMLRNPVTVNVELIEAIDA